MLNKEIKQLRLNQGYTQSVLAQKAGVSLPTIQNIESGKANPSLQVLIKILSAMGARLEIHTESSRTDILSLFNMDLLAFKKNNLQEIILQFQKKYNLKSISNREQDLLISLYACLHDHYPNWLKQRDLFSYINIILKQMIQKIDRNRLIKFRRIWSSKLCQVI